VERASPTFSSLSPVSPVSRMRQTRRVLRGFSNTGCPSISAEPAEALRNPADTDSRLVLPEPLRPSSP
jgi:hypothetical protein